jgi:hypothetical protein
MIKNLSLNKSLLFKMCSKIFLFMILFLFFLPSNIGEKYFNKYLMK